MSFDEVGTKVASSSEWTIVVLDWRSAHWAIESVLISPVFEAFFMEDMSASQLSNGLTIVLRKVSHTDDAALLHFRVLWVISLLFEVDDSLNLRNSSQMLKSGILFGFHA